MASAAGVSGSQLSLIPWNRHKKSLIFLIKMCILSRKRHLNDVKFKDIVEFLRNKGYNVIVYNTICKLPRNDREKQERLQLMLIP